MTHTWIFLKTDLFYPYKKYPRPDEERFRNHPRPHENAVIFEIRKQIHFIFSF